jgi:hypothetical protein
MTLVLVGQEKNTKIVVEKKIKKSFVRKKDGAFGAIFFIHKLYIDKIEK